MCVDSAAARGVAIGVAAVAFLWLSTPSQAQVGGTEPAQQGSSGDRGLVTDTDPIAAGVAAAAAAANDLGTNSTSSGYLKMGGQDWTYQGGAVPRPVVEFFIQTRSITKDSTGVFFNTTALQSAPPGIQEWVRKNAPGTSGETYGTREWQDLYAFAQSLSVMNAAADALAPFKGLLPDLTGPPSSWTDEQRGKFFDSLIAAAKTDPYIAAKVNDWYEAHGSDASQLAALDILYGDLTLARDNAQAVYDQVKVGVDNYIQMQTDLSQKNPDWGQYNSHWLVEPDVQSNGTYISGYDPVTAADLQAMTDQMTQIYQDTLAADTGGLASGALTTTLALAQIYQNYIVQTGQGGSSVVLVPSSMISMSSDVIVAPSSQILVPSSQLQMPTSVMTSLDLQPALCGR